MPPKTIIEHDWLGFDRYSQIEAPSDEEGFTSFNTSGILTGVDYIDWVKLKRALALEAIDYGSGVWAVLDAAEYGPFDEADLEHVQFINVQDLQDEPCYCWDHFDRCSSEKAQRARKVTLCKHTLAALIAAGHPDILEAVKELRRRDSIAAAVRTPTQEVS